MKASTAHAGRFRASTNKAAKFCEDLGLIRWHNPLPSYPDRIVSAARQSSYRTEWEMYIAGSHYDIILDDGSIFQFKNQPRQKSSLSYTFYECPLEALTYAEFVKDVYGVERVGFDVLDEYEMYLAQCVERDHVTPVRYDYSPELYRQGAHPASHIHFGRQSEIRTSCRRIMQPMAFVLFVIRQFYPNTWEAKFHLRDDAEQLARQVRAELVEVDAGMFSGKDLWEIYLH